MNYAKISKSCTFRVMNDDPSLPTVNVLVPSYGVCSIDRSNVKTSPASFVGVAQDVLRRSGSSVYHLRLSLDPEYPEEVTGLVPFIRLFGDSLSTLSIGPGFWPFINIHEIVQACPNLYEIAFEGVTWSSFREIFDLYEIDDCRARNLKLTKLCVADPGNNKQLANIITNPSSHFYKSVRR